MLKNKIGSSQQVRELEKRKVRMLRSDLAFHASLVNPEGADQENLCEDSRIDVKAAMLEAERRKAEGIVAFQRSRGFY